MTQKEKAFIAKGFDEKLYQKYYHQHQISYIRQRLRCVKYFADGNNFATISEKLGVCERLARNTINRYLLGGFELLVQRDTRKQPTLLTTEQEQSFKQVILTTLPTEQGYESNIWTGALMIDYLQKTYNVTYKSGIYDLLERLNMSHQRGHADYSNADVEEQIAFLEAFEQTLYQESQSTAIVFADEFSVAEKPSTYYAWAEKNTRPKVVTNEKKRKN